MQSEQIFFKNRATFSPFSDTHKALPLRKRFPPTVLSEERQSCYPVVLPVEQTKQIVASLLDATLYLTKVSAKTTVNTVESEGIRVFYMCTFRRLVAPAGFSGYL